MLSQHATQAKTLDRFLQAWKDKNTDATIALWSAGFTHQLLPASLGMPAHSRVEAEIVYPSLMSSLSNWNVSDSVGT